jgi:hypothetical protein
VAGVGGGGELSLYRKLHDSRPIWNPFVVLVTSCFRYLASAPKVHWQAGAVAPGLEQEPKPPARACSPTITTGGGFAARRRRRSGHRSTAC